MSPPPDLDTPDNIAVLVKNFYAHVVQDTLLGPVFTEQANIDWNEHHEKLTAFWCAILLGIPGFKGRPTQKHEALSAVKPFRTEQFARWVELFHNTVDDGWKGPYAEMIKVHATRIARAQSRLIPSAEAWDNV